MAAALSVMGVIQIFRAGSVTGRDLEIKTSRRECVEAVIRVFVSPDP